MKCKRSKINLLAISVLIMFSLLIIGCGSEEAKSNSSGEGGILKISIVRNPKNFGHPATSLGTADLLVSAPAIEGLLRLNEKGEPEPWLATEWKVDSTAKTITMTLRKGVKFHDGTDFNAEAVKWNLEEYIATKRAELASVSSVDVVDEYTVRLNLSKNDALLIPNLACTFPGKMISPKATKEKNAEWAAVNPVGTGPFKFVKLERDVKVVYEKFADYWQKGRPYLDGIEYQIIADPMTQIAALQRGDINVITDLDPKNASDLEKNGSYVIAKTVMPGRFPHLAPDSLHKDSPFANVKVRQAFLHAVDLPTIAKQLGYGYWEALKQPAAAKSWAFGKDVQGYSYDPGKAKQLLVEAGFPNGFEMTLHSQNYAPNPELMTALQGYLREVGIKAKIDLLEPAAHLQIMTTGGYKNGALMVPGTVVPNELGGHARNFGAAHAKRYPALDVPEDVVESIGKAVVETNPDLIQDKTRQINKKIVDEHAMIFWLYTMPGLAAKSKQIKGDGISEIMTYEWTPENASISKK